MNENEAMVSIPISLFDEIEAYLGRQSQAKDGEAARLLQVLEDLEIDRQARENFPESNQN